MKKATLTIGVLATGILGVTALVFGRPSVEAAAPSHTVKVTTGTVTRVEPLAGTVTSTSEASISYSGRPTTVSSVAVTVGQSVSSGQTLATIANGVTLTAPFAGKVVQLNLNAGNVVPSSSSVSSNSSATTSSGQFSGGGGFAARGPVGGQSVVASAGQALSITIANTSAIDVTASVSELDEHWFQSGQSATFVIPGEPGYTYSGQVEAVNQDATTSGTAVTYPVTLSLKVPKGAPTPWLGMSVEVFVPVSRETGLMVPITAIHANSTGNYYVIADGHKQAVTLGLIGTNNAIVTAGLKAGDTVVAPPSPSEQPVTVQIFTF